MKSYKSSNLRNVAVIGHGKTGKTSLLDACLFNAGAVKRLGSVEEHTSALDCEPEEESRGMTINLKLAACEWRDYKINFIDTPGYPDFVGEVKGALTAADSALIVISAPSGIEVETEKAWRYAEEAELPRAFFINKMDREHADFNQVVEELRVRFGAGVVPVQLPIGQEAAFQGVVDLLALHMKIVTHDEEDLIADIPEYIQGDVEEARQKLIESVAEFNNELLEKYIEGTEITEVEVAAALIEGIQAGKIFPVFCGSAKQNIGVKKLMNGIADLDRIAASAESDEATHKLVSQLREKCYDAMNDDFATPLVIAHLFEACSVVNKLVDHKATISEADLKELADTMRLFAFELLGLRPDNAGSSSHREEAFGKVVDMVLDLRSKAKASKDWATSDRIRDELAELGFEVKDTKDGATWKLK